MRPVGEEHELDLVGVEGAEGPIAGGAAADVIDLQACDAAHQVELGGEVVAFAGGNPHRLMRGFGVEGCGLDGGAQIELSFIAGLSDGADGACGVESGEHELAAGDEGGGDHAEDVEVAGDGVFVPAEKPEGAFAETDDGVVGAVGLVGGGVGLNEAAGNAGLLCGGARLLEHAL
jgi:hypothetical protein